MRSEIVRERRRRIAGYTLVAPACILLLITFAVPLIYAFLISISDSNAVIDNQFVFVGLDNYLSVIKSSKFQSALFHTCFFVITTILLELVIGFGIALLLYREVAGSRIFRLIFAVCRSVRNHQPSAEPCRDQGTALVYRFFYGMGYDRSSQPLACSTICHPGTAGRAGRIIGRIK